MDFNARNFFKKRRIRGEIIFPKYDFEKQEDNLSLREQGIKQKLKEINSIFCPTGTLGVYSIYF